MVCIEVNDHDMGGRCVSCSTSPKVSLSIDVFDEIKSSFMYEKSLLQCHTRCSIYEDKIIEDDVESFLRRTALPRSPPSALRLFSSRARLPSRAHHRDTPSLDNPANNSHETYE